MGMVYLHCYVAKDATPTVADEINGPTVGVDEEELRKNPEAVKQRLISDFRNWLKGKPALEAVTEIKGSSEHYRAVEEPKTSSWMGYRQQAEEMRGRKEYGLVGQIAGAKMWLGEKLGLHFRDVKGRFARRPD